MIIHTSFLTNCNATHYCNCKVTNYEHNALLIQLKQAYFIFPKLDTTIIECKSCKAYRAFITSKY